MDGKREDGKRMDVPWLVGEQLDYGWVRKVEVWMMSTSGSGPNGGRWVPEEYILQQ